MQTAPRRRQLHRGADVLADDVRSSPAHEIETDAGRLAVIITYQGIAEDSRGAPFGLVDANQALIVDGCREPPPRYRAADGADHAALVITLSADAVAPLQILRQNGVSVHSLSARARLDVLTLLREPRPQPAARMEDILRRVFRGVASSPAMRGRPPRVVQLARRMMNEQHGQRRPLADIAGAIGVTPSYLTQEFTRSMGMPLYQYQMRLRMTRALLELPECADITELALALGFSSHSHFSAAFKAFFGVTPSAFRNESFAFSAAHNLA